ncbi:hypothetical protein [Dyadobacter sp. Leaf189]|nr:hypothetical protein [Dyadobacter sp. Leaf189]
METSITYAKPAELPFFGTVVLTVLTGSLLWMSIIYSIFFLIVS